MADIAVAITAAIRTRTIPARPTTATTHRSRPTSTTITRRGPITTAGAGATAIAIACVETVLPDERPLAPAFPKRNAGFFFALQQIYAAVTPSVNQWSITTISTKIPTN